MIKKLALILLTVISTCHVVSSEPLAGASYIGLCSPYFPCKAALGVFKGVDVLALGFLADSFSSKRDCKCLDQFMTMGTSRYVRVHILNGTCFPERGRKCGKDDFFHGMTSEQAESAIRAKDKRLLSRFRLRLRKLRSYFGDRALVRYSPVLESPFSNRTRRILLREAAKIVPRDSLVDSTAHRICASGYICELHGDKPHFSAKQQCIGDLDGISFYDSDLKRYAEKTAKCEAAFFWTTSFNLVPREYIGPFILPSARQHQSPKRDFRHLRHYLKTG